MRLLKRAASSLILLCLVQVVHADEKDLSKQFSVCMGKANGEGAAMTECIEQETKHQDSRLNKNYQALAGSVAGGRKKQLQSAQRLWIQYRDANCAFYFDPDGGTLARISANECVMSMTAERASELERLKQ